MQDRIDYIYYKGDHWNAVDSVMISGHPVRYPSDHGAVITTFMYGSRHVIEIAV